MPALAQTSDALTLGSNTPAQYSVSQLSRNPAAIYSTLSRERRWRELEEFASTAAQKDASDVTALRWLGVARFERDEPISALQALRSAQKLGLDTADLHLELGQIYYKLNQFTLFEQQMDTASHLDPRNGTPKYLLGFYRLSVKSDASGALELLQRAAALQPDDPKTLYELGYCLEASGRSAEAKEQYARALDLVQKSGQTFAWPSQGMARLLLNEDPEQAVRFATDAVRMEPREPTNHLTLAKAYERLGDLPKAVTEARLAADGNPTSASIRYLLFRLYRREGQSALAAHESAIFEKINAIYGPE